METSEQAAMLAEYARATSGDDDRLTVAASTGRLLSIIAAGSSMPGVASVESAESLASILDATKSLLDEALH